MEPNTSPPSAGRRNLLLAMLAGIGAALTAMAGWPLLRFLAPSGSNEGTGSVEISRAGLKPGSAHFFEYQGRPAVLLQPQPGEFVALTAVCTHLGCIVKWVKDQQLLVCPCHGGRFSVDGNVVSGPPPSPLKSYPVAVNADTVIVGKEA